MYDADRNSQAGPGTIERARLLRTCGSYAAFYDRVFGALWIAERRELTRDVAAFEESPRMTYGKALAARSTNQPGLFHLIRLRRNAS